MSADIQVYENAANRVKSRLGAVRFCNWMRSSHWVFGGLALLAVFFVRHWLQWTRNELWLVLGILGSWLVIGWVISFVASRPHSRKALSILDEKGGWKDQFSSAWAFLKKGEDEQISRRGRDAHLAIAGKKLPGALAELKQILPLPQMRWMWILPVVAILFAASSLFRPGIDAGDLLLTDEMQNAAAEQGDQLKAETERVKNLDALNEEEKKELEKLRSEVDTVAEDLASTEGQTAMEVLEALESRARAAEKLAEKLGVASDAWASEQMLAEMSSHPDTADLALAIKDKQADPAADESDRIAGVLNDNEITRETGNRFNLALEQIMKQATEEDETKPVGERVGNASSKMLQSSPKTAAREFEELAKHFRIVRDREEAQERLEELANKLRDAGSEISGSKLQQMKKLAQNDGKQPPMPKGLQQLNANPLANQIQNMQAPQMPQPGQMGTPQSQKGQGQNQAPVPGAQNSPKGGQAKSGGLKAPIPGQGQKGKGGGQGMAMGKGAKDDKGKGKGGGLSAPIPGMPNGAPVPGMGLGGQGSASAQGAGGNEAGNGTAEMVDNQTDAVKATKDVKVVAQTNKTGESTTRAIQGQARTEQAERSRQEVMADFMAVEEQALDGQALPLSRRNHVLRYFSEIRNQFEKESNSGN